MESSTTVGILDGLSHPEVQRGAARVSRTCRATRRVAVGRRGDFAGTDRRRCMQCSEGGIGHPGLRSADYPGRDHCSGERLVVQFDGKERQHLSVVSEYLLQAVRSAHLASTNVALGAVRGDLDKSSGAVLPVQGQPTPALAFPDLHPSGLEPVRKCRGHPAHCRGGAPRRNRRIEPVCIADSARGTGRPREGGARISRKRCRTCGGHGAAE